MSSKKVVIIGAGPGGLAASLLLANAGLEVHIVERLSHVGGRTSSHGEQGFRFALGPTMFINPEILDGLLATVGRRLHDEVELRRLDPMYRILFGKNGGDLVCWSDKEKMREAIRGIAPADAANLDRYFADNKKKLEVMTPVMKNPSQGFADWINIAKNLHVLRPWNSLDEDLRKYFSDERIRRAFSFHSKYIGMSPLNCPSMFSTLAYNEHVGGIWHPIGGCASLTQAMARIALDMGVTISLNEEVEAIQFEGKRATSLKTNQGEHKFDKLVINADFARAMTRLVPDSIRSRWTDAKLAKKRFSCSTFMMYLGIEGRYDDLPHQSLYLPDDYAQSLHDIEEGHVLSKDPCYYVENASITDPTLAPKGMSTLYVFAPVTHEHANVDWKKEAGAFRRRILDKFPEMGIDGVERRIRYERVLTPQGWREQYEIHKGALFSLSHNIGQLLGRRPLNRFTELEDVYLVGGGTHPGSGLPVIFESARITSRLMLQDWGMSTQPVEEVTPAVPLARAA